MTDRGDLSPEARALLGAAHGGDEPRAEDRERVRARMIAAIGAGAAGTAGGAGAAGAAREGAAAIGVGGGGVAAGGAVAAKIAALVLGLAVVATGAFVALRSDSPTPTPTTAPAPAPALTPAPAPAPAPAPSLSVDPDPEADPEPEIAVEPAPKRKPIRTGKPARTEDVAPPAPTADSLREERALLARATKALRAGDGDGALEALAEHQQKFPKGVLAEERGATRVLALCAAGRDAEAARARDRFLAAWPRSVHAARVTGACVD